VKGERMIRRIFFEEGLPKGLVVLGVKLLAVVLALWVCLHILPREAKEIASYFLVGPLTTP
jgi:hypothetical protein